MGTLVPNTGVSAAGGSLYKLAVPLPLFLGDGVNAEAASRIRELIRGQPRIAKLAAADEVGVVHVLETFEMTDILALKRRQREVIGLPFVERFLRCPQVLSPVQSLPVFDLVLPPEFNVSCTGLTPVQKDVCSNYVQWMGSRMADDVSSVTGFIVANRVSLQPNSKYQAALARNIPVVGLSFLETAWAARAMPRTAEHELSGLQGLRICFDPLDQDLLDQCQHLAQQNGAVIETFERAEVLVIRDVMHHLYNKATQCGMLRASPRWLLHCCSSKRCEPIVGEFEPSAPRAVPLPSAGTVAGAQDSTILMDAVLNFLYLPKDARAAAQELAWQCGAYTTIDPSDDAITHVLFKSVCRTTAQAPVPVSIPVDRDRICFIDMSWLEACAQQGRWVEERRFPQQEVICNPTADKAGQELRKNGTVHQPRRLFRQESAPMHLPLPAASGSPSEPLPLADAPVHAEEGKLHLPIDVQPIPEMEACKLRITGLWRTRDSQGRRAQIEELARNLGAEVLGKDGRVSEVTHWICVFPEALEQDILTKARHKKQHVLTPQWLLDCLRHKTRVAEQPYDIGGATATHRDAQSQLTSTASSRSSNTQTGAVSSVLRDHLLLLSVQALGSEKRLMEMTEELGGEARTWRNCQELQAHTGTSAKIIVLVESGEARQADGTLMKFFEDLAKLGGSCVLFQWLTEVHAQWRLLPEESFRPPFPSKAEDESGAKRARTDEKATFAWQTDASKRLEELAKDAQAKERLSKAQQKTMEGLRVAELRQEAPSRLGG
mmetsp:Transcript_41305/g.95109  ORF Transcript_41305/g.95109 Transcript_41305/m.95109 type:complete len:776 (-) Transcript_41305:83-2410(-)